MLCTGSTDSTDSVDSNTRRVLDEETNQSEDPTRTPGPYVEGMVLDLSVNWAGGPPSEERVLLTVTKVFEITVSPVMQVQWVSSSGEMRTAILKLFDRRYSSQKPRGHRSTPHNEGKEACWQRYVQSGKAPWFFSCTKTTDKELGEGWDSHYMEPDGDTVDTWHRTACKEAMMQYRALQAWRREIRAYEHLEKLQGKCVPLFYGTTSFSLEPQGLDPEFFRVGGILIQHIDGFNFDSLLHIKKSSPDTDYHGLIQRVVDATEAVNKCGVVNYDYLPDNIIVQTGSMQPFEFDFSKCYFREDYASENEYNDIVALWGNPFASGGIVARRLNREFKLGIDYKYGSWWDRTIRHTD